jgi:hypothetical protein
MANEFRFEDYPDEMKFTPVTDKAIAALVTQYGLEFSADYLSFLKAHNGFYFDPIKAARPLAPDIETFDFIRYLFGVDTGLEYNDLRIYLAMPGLWDKPFRAFAYPVADSRGGDPIVQVYKGRAKGRIYFVDHEVFPDAGEVEDDGIDLDSMSADETLAYLIDVRGCLIEVARSFSDFLGKLVVYDDDGSVNVSIRGPLA